MMDRAEAIGWVPGFRDIDYSRTDEPSRFDGYNWPRPETSKVTHRESGSKESPREGSTGARRNKFTKGTQNGKTRTRRSDWLVCGLLTAVFTLAWQISRRTHSAAPFSALHL